MFVIIIMIMIMILYMFLVMLDVCMYRHAVYLRACPLQPAVPRCSPSVAGWGPGQLAEEVKRGVWFPAAASSGFVPLTRIHWFLF